MEVAILIFEDLAALDAVGPYEVLSRLPGAQVRFVAAEAGPKTTDTRSLALVAEHPLSDVPRPEVVVVPGGIGTRALLEDDATLRWLRAAHESSRWTTSVCTGSLLLGAAGILDGLRATTHWAVRDQLAAFGADPISERVVEQGKVLTAAGVSAGIDMALTLAHRLAGEDVAQAVQLMLEYDPQPPFDAGSPAKAPEHVLAMVSDAQRREETAAG